MKDKIYYFQEKSNDILDLQDDFTAEEIGIYFILKAAYFKYAGEIKKDNICQRCKFFGDKTLLDKMVKILFEEQEGLLVNKSWLSDINDIKERSQKRKEAAEKRWKDGKKPKTPKPPKTPSFTPPTLQQVKDYCLEKGYMLDCQRFIDFYIANDWHDSNGNKVKNWKQKVITWLGRDKESLTLPSNVIEINKLVGDIAVKEIKEYKLEVDFVCLPSGAEKVRALNEQQRQIIRDKFNNRKINLV